MSMEEQRQRQEEESRRVTAASGEEAPTPEAPIADSEEAMLQQALSMSTPQTPVFDFSAMTEEQQIEYAMRLSLQNLEAETEAEGSGDKDSADKQDEKEAQAGASAMETDAQVRFNYASENCEIHAFVLLFDIFLTAEKCDVLFLCRSRHFPLLTKSLV